MILAVDAGNTTVSMALAEGDNIIARSKAPVSEARSFSGCLMLLEKFLDGITPEDAIISSVVPAANRPLTASLTRILGHVPVVMSEDLPTGICFDLYDRSNLGSDRVADLSAAMELMGAPVMTFDLGTCTTVTVLGPDREILGGMILPGIQLSLDAMHRRTGKLPSLAAQPPSSLIGRDTAGCMESGAVIGTAAVIDSFIERTQAQLGCPVPAVLTGGAGPLVLPWCRQPLRYEPDLQLKGLLHICRRARQAEDAERPYAAAEV